MLLSRSQVRACLAILAVLLTLAWDSRSNPRNLNGFVFACLETQVGAGLEKVCDMPPNWITATGSFWGPQTGSLIRACPGSSAVTPYAAKSLPYNTKLPLDVLDASMAGQISGWLCKHGRVRAPRWLGSEAEQAQNLKSVVSDDPHNAGSETEALCRAG